jgi:anti-sigma B factor antagonist
MTTLDDANTLTLGPELTIAYAAAAHEQLLDAVGKSTGDLQLDLANVTDFDSSAVQLLLATRRSLAARGDSLHIRQASATVRDGLAVFGLQGLLASTAAATA